MNIFPFNRVYIYCLLNQSVEQFPTGLRCPTIKPKSKFIQIVIQMRFPHSTLMCPLQPNSFFSQVRLNRKNQYPILCLYFFSRTILLIAALWITRFFEKKRGGVNTQKLLLFILKITIMSPSFYPCERESRGLKTYPGCPTEKFRHDRHIEIIHSIMRL